MTDNNVFKVLLYTDGTEQSFSAAVYAANLFHYMPKMQLTVLHVQENVYDFKEDDPMIMEPWPTHPDLDWVKHLMGEADSDKRRQYSEIIAQTKKLFSDKKQKVNHQVIYTSSNIYDIVKAILSYASKDTFGLIIMGTRGLTSLKGLIHGSVAHSVLSKSTIPVLLIKKLPQKFIDHYRLVLETEEDHDCRKIVVLRGEK